MSAKAKDCCQTVCRVCRPRAGRNADQRGGAKLHGRVGPPLLPKNILASVRFALRSSAVHRRLCSLERACFTEADQNESESDGDAGQAGLGTSRTK
jgi:hypothetical protein